MADQPQGDNSQTKSRYEQVKRILDEAQGKATPSYQGYGRFWNLPLDQFLKVTIYGVRMIAGEGTQDICEDHFAASHAGGGEPMSKPGPVSSAEAEMPVSSGSCCGEQQPDPPPPGPSHGRGKAS